MFVALMRAPKLSALKLVSLFACRVIPTATAFEIQNTSSHHHPFRAAKTFAMSSSSTSNEAQGPQTFKVLGICGGIGSGKSSACKTMVSMGCLAHLDADLVAHSVYSPGSQAVKDIVAEFGKEILQDAAKEEIDRKKLGALVFSDRSEMAKLERIVWPHVKTLLVDRIQAEKSEWAEGKSKSSSDGTSTSPVIPVVILEAAVLLDAGWDDILDGLWVVTAPREVALQRLMETRGLSEEESNKRIDAQLSRRGIGNLEEEIEKKSVTNVIDNSGNEEELTKTLSAALLDPKSWK